MDIIGLVLNFVGAIMIFFYGLHPMISESRAIHLTLEQVDESEIKQAKKHKMMSRIGLIFLAVGFLLQLIEKIIYHCAC